MARIEGADPRKKGFFTRMFLRIAYWMTRRKVGRVVMPVQLAGHRPRLLMGVGAMETGLDRSRALDPALKALASVRVSTRIGCPV
jgi:hypothetical protein